MKCKYSVNPDKAKPAERQGQKATDLRVSKMAELPKDVKSFRGGRPLFLVFPLNTSRWKGFRSGQMSQATFMVGNRRGEYSMPWITTKDGTQIYYKDWVM